MITTPEELAAKAASIIKVKGHTKLVLRSGYGKVCLRGALYEALTGDARRPPHVLPDYNPVYLWLTTEARIIEIIRDAYQEFYFTDVTEWNDRPERTAEEVIAVLRMVAGDATTADTNVNEYEEVMA